MTRSILLSIACLFLVSGLVWGQASGQISGSVRDETGAVIPGVEIKATQTATGATRTALSNEQGAYVFANLSLGPYLLEASQPGFSPFTQTGIVIQVQSNLRIDIPLKVGAIGDQVTVEANLAQVETRATSIGQVVDNQRVSEMPLNGRNPIELIFLAGMATTGSGAINSVRNYPTIVVSVAGGQGSSVSYSLDGTIYQDPYNSIALPMPFPDALQEFKVETSVLQPQYGFHAGAAINAVTKSGTNQFHGDAFEFLRNGSLNARDFFAAKRDTLKRNQFGGVIGGPILKDKLFFFGGYQGNIQRSAPSDLTGYVPTPAMLAGDFTKFASAACQQGKDVTLSAPFGANGFAKNTIDPARFDRAAVKFAATLPKTLDDCGLVRYGNLARAHEDLYVGRIDYQKSDKSSFFGRFTAGHLIVDSTFDGKNPLSINTYGVNDLDYQVALGHTYLVTQNIINNFRLSASRTNVVKTRDNYASYADFGADVTELAGKVISMTVSGGPGFAIGGGSANPGQSHNGPNPSIAEDVSWIKGNHQFGFGGTLYHQQMNYWSGVNATGSMTFNGTATGLGLADLLTGQINAFGHGTLYGFYNRQYYESVYGQDTWKVNKRLTLNYGIRWEPYIAVSSKWGQIHYVDQNLFAKGYTSPVFPNAPPGVIFPGDPNYACGKSYECDKWMNFFPRLGLAIDPVGDGKMTIRASFGMAGDRTHMFFPNQMSFGSPFADRINLSGAQFANPWATFPGVPGYSDPGKNPFPVLVTTTGIGSTVKNAPFPTAGYYVNNVENLDKNFKQMYVNMWNLSVQRQVGSWLFAANYVGNSTIHLVMSTETNPAVFLGLQPCQLRVVQPNGTVGLQNYSTCSTTANQNFRRVMYLQDPIKGQFFANVPGALNSGTASYEGMYLSANKALTRGVSMLANYTWSHCIGDPYNQQTSGDGNTPPGMRRSNRGNCNSGINDVRHAFNLNMVLNAPKFSNKTLNLIASKWQISPILQIKTGNWISVTSGTDRALTTAGGQTANQISSNVFAANKGQACSNVAPPCLAWLDKAAFAIPDLGTYGNLRTGTIQGPGLIQLNVALSRTFGLGENRSVQLRGEVFNLPNHLNPANPNSTLNSAQFGVITSDQNGPAGTSGGGTPGDYRVIQLALKLVF